MKDRIILTIEIVLLLNLIAGIVFMFVLDFNNNETFSERVRAFFLKIQRKYFMKSVELYAVPKGKTLFEMNLITKDIRKAEYKNYKGQRIMIKNENCIYDYADSLHEVKPKFYELINKALNK